jgi:hypothetical protein
VSVRRYPPCVNNRSQRLLGEIEAGALDEETPIGTLLRKVIALGGQAGSEELRDWATRELRGYGPEDELPPYRILNAPLKIDWRNMRGWVRGETISPLELPEIARGKVGYQIDLRNGIAEIEQLARQSEQGEVVKLGPPGSQELVAMMNAKRHGNGLVDLLYWDVSTVVLGGVIDQVRTTLTAMTAEIRATTPDKGEIPPAVATNSLHFAVTGERSNITFAAPQPWWRTAGAVIAGIVGLLVAMAGGLFALMQAQGWRF